MFFLRKSVAAIRDHALTLALILLVLVTRIGGAQAQPGEGKSLTIVVGSSVGGGYDAYARMLARHMSRHLAGAPGILVQNMPGAASLKAVHYLDANAPKDGTIIAAFNPGMILESLLNAEKVRFRFTAVAFLGSITRDLRACYAWAATGIRTFDDLKRQKRFNMGAPAPGSSAFINEAELKNLFGIAVHQVTGYAGSAETRLAIERRELDGDCGAWSSVPPDWIASRKINPLVKFASMAVPGLPPDVPFAGDLAANKQDKELLDFLTAPDALGRPFVVSRLVPPSRLESLRAAFERTMQDAAFIAEAEKLDLPVVGPLPGGEAERTIKSIYDVSPQLLARAQDIAGR
jgi:tripartite-type tricarboxylate transporter receptor subunit TctC